MSFHAPPAPSRRSVPLVWVLVLLLVTTGAGIAVTSVVLAERAQSPKGAVTIADDLGRTERVPYDPARMAVVRPSIMDFVYRLGVGSHVVGVDCYAASLGGLADDYSPDQIARWNLSASMCVQVGPTFVPSMLVDAHVDLVLASTIVSLATVEEITSEIGVPVVMLQPPTLSGILVDDSLVGEIFGVGSAADALNAQLSAELYNASVLTANVSSLPTVLVTYSVDTNGYWTFGPGTFGDSLTELAGAVGLGAAAGLSYPELTPAQVLSGDQCFIVCGVGFGLTVGTCACGPEW